MGLPETFHTLNFDLKYLVGKNPNRCLHYKPINQQAAQLFINLIKSGFLPDKPLHTGIFCRDKDRNRYFYCCINCGRILVWLPTEEEKQNALKKEAMDFANELAWELYQAGKKQFELKITSS